MPESGSCGEEEKAHLLEKKTLSLWAHFLGGGEYLSFGGLCYAAEIEVCQRGKRKGGSRKRRPFRRIGGGLEKKKGGFPIKESQNLD